MGTGDVLAGIEEFAWASHHDSFVLPHELGPGHEHGVRLPVQPPSGIRDEPVDVQARGLVRELVEGFLSS